MTTGAYCAGRAATGPRRSLPRAPAQEDAAVPPGRKRGDSSRGPPPVPRPVSQVRRPAKASWSLRSAAIPHHSRPLTPAREPRLPLTRWAGARTDKSLRRWSPSSLETNHHKQHRHYRIPSFLSDWPFCATVPCAVAVCLTFPSRDVHATLTEATLPIPRPVSQTRPRRSFPRATVIPAHHHDTPPPLRKTRLCRTRKAAPGGHSRAPPSFPRTPRHPRAPPRHTTPAQENAAVPHAKSRPRRSFPRSLPLRRQGAATPAARPPSNSARHRCSA